MTPSEKLWLVLFKVSLVFVYALGAVHKQPHAFYGKSEPTTPTPLFPLFTCYLREKTAFKSLFCY